MKPARTDIHFYLEDREREKNVAEVLPGFLVEQSRAKKYFAASFC
jgi:hypothetical protein